MPADLRPSLRGFLLDEPLIAAVVAARVFPVVLPQGERRTSIVYTQITARPDHHMQGPSGLNRMRVQVDTWATGTDAADELARLVKDRLDGYRGPMTSEGSPGVELTTQGSFISDRRDDYDSVANLYRVSADYLVWWEEL